MMQAKGRLIGLGVGPGDPELITVKALRLLRESPVVAYFVARARRAMRSASSRRIWSRRRICCRWSIR
jgi:precorrin-2 methylase